MVEGLYTDDSGAIWVQTDEGFIRLSEVLYSPEEAFKYNLKQVEVVSVKDRLDALPEGTVIRSCGTAELLIKGGEGEWFYIEEFGQESSSFSDDFTYEVIYER